MKPPLPTELSDTQWASLSLIEGDELEFKSGAGTDPLQDAMVAFSNTTGGTILIGVDDHGAVVGRALDQPTADRVHQAARDANDVGRYSIDEITVGGRLVTRVQVQARREGFAQTSRGRLLVRRGPHNVPLIGTDLWTFLSERRLVHFETTATTIPVESVDPDALAGLADAYGWTAPADWGDRLHERQFAIPEGKLTVAGALVLGVAQAGLGLRKAQVEIRRYRHDGPDYDRREVFAGRLDSQVCEAARFIFDELGSDLVVAGVHRYETPRLPLVVIRESIANAVAHRSYEQDGTGVLVQLFPDRVVVTSPGRLPEPVTIETIRQAQSARNPAIIDALRRFDLAEDAGRGVDVIQDQMQSAMLNPPVFEETASSVVVTLPMLGPISPRERAWVNELESRGAIEGADRLLLVHAARGTPLTNGFARDLLGLDSIQARAALQRLRDLGLVVQLGHRGGAQYVLANDLDIPASFRMTMVDLEQTVVDAAAESALSNADVRRLTGFGRDEALSMLRRLVDERRLAASGATRGTRYTAIP